MTERGDRRAKEGRDIAARAGEFADAPTPDDDDALDRLGTRIGRALGLVISIALLAALLIFVLGRAP